MRPLFSLLSLFALAAPWASAQQSDIYQCVQPDGKILYTNSAPGKGCKRLESAVNVFPSQRPNPAAGATGGTSVQTAAAKPAATSPANFPRVDSDTQKARDSDRRQILQDELRAEEKKLGELKREFNNGEPERRGDERNYAKYQERVASMRDDISRTEKNIQALQRELSNVR